MSKKEFGWNLTGSGKWMRDVFILSVESMAFCCQFKPGFVKLSMKPTDPGRASPIFSNRRFSTLHLASLASERAAIPAALND